MYVYFKKNAKCLNLKSLFFNWNSSSNEFSSHMFDFSIGVFESLDESPKNSKIPSCHSSKMVLFCLSMEGAKIFL